MVNSGKGLCLTVSKEHGFICCCLFVIVHTMYGSTARHPDTTQTPGIYQWSSDGMNEFFVVSLFLSMVVAMVLTICIHNRFERQFGP